MSRYLLLFLLNIPFIAAAIISALTQFKLHRITLRRYVTTTILWLIILISLAGAQPLYVWLFSHKLTNTEPLSLFDVIQITGIVMIFYIANRTRAKVDTLEKRVQDLHQELSILLSGTINR